MYFSFSLLFRGGPMIWVLLALAAGTIVLLAERAFYLHRAQIRAREFLDGIKNILAKRRLIEALTVCEETPGPVAAVVKVALLHAHDGEINLRHAVREAAIMELPGLERRIGAVAAIAQVAPLAGLLGTVIAMAETFRRFSEGAPEYATAKALTGGMEAALLCAAGSLAVAILGHLSHHFLGGRVRAIVRDLEWSANEIMRYLLVEYRATPPAPANPADPQPT
jgi:biopolymer transport protein ExbB